MKRLFIIFSTFLLCSCAGMDGMSSGGSGMHGGGATYPDINRHDSPSDTYFGG